MKFSDPMVAFGPLGLAVDGNNTCDGGSGDSNSCSPGSDEAQEDKFAFNRG